jgi:DNA-directed RNA polymerase specialized sigma24 family protein
MSIEEAARALGMSQLSVRVHLSRARQKIKVTMKEKYSQLREERP